MDPIYQANAIAKSWPALIQNVPTALKLAFDTFTALHDVEKPNPTIDVSTLTPANAESEVLRVAAALAAAEQFGAARYETLWSLAQQLSSTARSAAPHIRDNLLPSFTTICEKFTRCVDAIGGEPNPSMADLVKRGGSAVDAFHEAAEIQKEIRRFDDWASSLAGLWGHSADPVCRIATPEDANQIATLDHARSIRSNGGLDVLYVQTATLGVFGLNLPHEAKRIRATAQTTKAEPAAAL